MVRSRWIFANRGSDEREHKSFETHLNLPIDFAGNRVRISLMISEEAREIPVRLSSWSLLSSAVHSSSSSPLERRRGN